MAKYKLKEGLTHREGGKRYTGPAVIESTTRLDKLFPERFTLAPNTLEFPEGEEADIDGAVTPDQETVAPPAQFELKHKGAGWYDVVRSDNGKAFNDASMRQGEARELLNSLSGQEEG